MKQKPSTISTLLICPIIQDYVIFKIFYKNLDKENKEFSANQIKWCILTRERLLLEYSANNPG